MENNSVGQQGEESKEEILRHFLIGCFQGQREMDDFMCNKYEDVYAAMEEYASNCVMTYHSETQSKEGEDDWKERFIKWDSEPKTTKQIIEWIEANFALNEGKQAGVSGAVEFAEWIEHKCWWSDEYEEDGQTKRDCIRWSNDPANFQFITTQQLYSLFREQQTSKI